MVGRTTFLYSGAVSFVPGKMSTTFVYGHFGAFEFVQFLAYSGLILGREPRPRFVSPPIVVVSLRHLDIVVEPNDFLLLQLVNRRPEAELPQQITLLFLLLLLFFRRGLGYK